MPTTIGRLRWLISGKYNLNRILITGATGYIGRHASIQLADRGYEVHGTSRRQLNECSIGVSAWHRVDARDAAAMIELVKALRPNCMLLSAWTTEHGRFWDDPANARWAEASAAVADAFWQAQGKRIVFVGSCVEYDWTDPILARGKVREDMAQDTPHTLYGRAKRWTAQYLSASAKKYKASFANARIFFPMGSGEDPRRFLPTVVRALLAQYPAEIGPGHQIRDVIDVRDVGAGLAALVDSEVVGPINFGSGRAVRLADLAELVGDMLNRRDLIRLGALAPRVGEAPVLVADTSRLNNELLFMPQHSINDTVKASIAYWLANKEDHNARTDR